MNVALREGTMAERQVWKIDMRGIREFGETLKAATDGFVSWLNEIRPALEKVAAFLVALPLAMHRTLRVLAKQGWYVDPEMPWDSEAPEALHHFLRGEIDQGHHVLCAYFDRELGRIEGEIGRQFPERVPVLRQAFEAHRLGHYALSTPVFLAQADGICQQLTKCQLYTRGGEQLKRALDGYHESPLLELLCTPLTENNPITFKPSERAGLVGILNRHAILHGESLDYGTHLNSCRAMSLLAYVCWALKKREDGA